MAVPSRGLQPCRGMARCTANHGPLRRVLASLGPFPLPWGLRTLPAKGKANRSSAPTYSTTHRENLRSKPRPFTAPPHPRDPAKTGTGPSARKKINKRGRGGLCARESGGMMDATGPLSSPAERPAARNKLNTPPADDASASSSRSFCQQRHKMYVWVFLAYVCVFVFPQPARPACHATPPLGCTSSAPGANAENFPKLRGEKPSPRGTNRGAPFELHRSQEAHRRPLSVV